MRPRTPSTTRLVLTCVIVLVFLTGCAPTPLSEGNRVSPTEARNETSQMMNDTIKFLGGPTGWSDRDNNPFLDCTVSGQPGHYTYGDQQGPGPGTPTARDQTVTALRSWLEKRGFTTRMGEHTPPDDMRYLYAKNGTVEKFSAYISPDFIGIETVSWCVTGSDSPTPTPNTTP